MLIFSIILTSLYIIYLLYEKKSNDRYLSSFKHVIHVNGIRGKTSVCRLIDANLRGAGYKVFTKTTGSTPFYIDTNGIEHLIKRKGTSNIREQLSIIKKAYNEHADILILECMAVNPELQNTSQKYIVKGDLNVITNVRYDHIFEMGENLDDIASSLCNTVPDNGVLFTADENYFEYFKAECKKHNSSAILCKIDKDIRNENEAIAYEIGKQLGINNDKFKANIRCYKEDFGASKLYRINNNTQFLNLFSVNDPQSTLNMLNKYIDDCKSSAFVYNHRLDRPDRLLLFIKYFFNKISFKKIYIIGENKSFALRLLKKHDITNVEILKDWHDILKITDVDILIGIGNIKGCAYELIKHMEEESINE